MKYSKRMMKYKNEYRPYLGNEENLKSVDWKKVLLGLVALEIIVSSILGAFMISKKNETPVEKYSKDLNKKYKKTKKKLSKKANKLMKEFEASTDDIHDRVIDTSDTAFSKGKEIKDFTLEKSKKSLSELNDLLDDITKKIKDKL